MQTHEPTPIMSRQRRRQLIREIAAQADAERKLYQEWLQHEASDHDLEALADMARITERYRGQPAVVQADDEGQLQAVRSKMIALRGRAGAATQRYQEWLKSYYATGQVPGKVTDRSARKRP